jgi:hypothetical protein
MYFFFQYKFLLQANSLLPPLEFHWVAEMAGRNNSNQRTCCAPTAVNAPDRCLHYVTTRLELDAVEVQRGNYV